MPVQDYIKDRRNKIVLGAVGAVGLIIGGVTGLSNRTPAYEVYNSTGNKTWGVNLQGDSTQSGAIASKTLTAANCDVKGTSTGMLTCGTDATSGGSTFGSGNVIATGDNRYVRKAGSTMTGALNINLTSGQRGLNVVQTASGAHLHAEKGLTSSGAFTWEGAASGATLVVSGQLSGAGLTDCDTAATSKLLWDTTTNRFSCGTDQSGSGGGGTNVSATGSATQIAYFTAAHTLSGATNTSFVQATKNFLVGTTTDKYRLTVKDSTNLAAIFYGYSTIGGDGSHKADNGNGMFQLGLNAGDHFEMHFDDWGQGGNTHTYFDSTYDSANAAMSFRFRTAGTPVTALSLLGHGGVGIGALATTAQGLLVVNSSVTQLYIRGWSSFGGATNFDGQMNLGSYAVIQGLSNYTGGATALTLDNTYDDPLSPILLRSRTSGTAVVDLAAFPTGVSIGRTTAPHLPKAKLDVIGTMSGAGLAVNGSGSVSMKLLVAAAGRADTSLEVVGTMSGSGLAVGGTGTILTKLLSTSATIDFASLLSVGCEESSAVTLNGVVDGDVCTMAVPSASEITNGIFSCRVSGANAVKGKFCTVVSGDPASGTFRFEVHHLTP